MRRFVIAALALAGLGAPLSSTVQAAILTYNPAGPTTNNNLSDPGNWVGGVAPVAGDTLVFPSGNQGGSVNNDFGSIAFDSIQAQSQWNGPENAPRAIIDR